VLQAVAPAVVSKWCQLVLVNLLKIHALVVEAQRGQPLKRGIAAAGADTSSNWREDFVRASEDQERKNGQRDILASVFLTFAAILLVL
jgi:hypothetical protein